MMTDLAAAAVRYARRLGGSQLSTFHGISRLPWIRNF
jgi:hypothetical protein